MSHPVSEAVFDPGLQPERTLLAWRRTCLSFGLGSVVAMRFTADALGFWAVLVGLVGLGLSIAAYLMTSIGYSRAHRALVAEGTLSRSGLPMALASLTALLLGGLCAAYLVHGVLS